MVNHDGVTRREFVTSATGAAVGALVAGQTVGAAAQAKRRYAIVGTGVRAIGMWGRPILRDYPDIVELVGLCDINPLRVEVAKTADGRHVPDLHQLRRHAHEGEAGHRDGDDRRRLSQSVSRPRDGARHRRDDREADGHRRSAVPRGARRREEDRPQDRRHPQLPLRAQAPEDQGTADGRRDRQDHVGRFQLVSRHDPRRRLLPPLAPAPVKSGSLWVHKASHHFDLINWWIDAEPVQVSALGSLANYGKSGPFRHTNCRPCPHKDKCSYYWDINRSRNLVALYNDCESADGYQRDGCVFKEDIDIFDTMNAVVRYSNGVNMSYSVNTFMPVEGYYLAFNGTKGRLEVRDYERQPWDPGTGTEMQRDQELRQARQDRDSDRDRGTRRRRPAAARPDFQEDRRARAHAPARLPRRRDVVPDRHRGPKEHRRGPADQDRGSGEVHVGSRTAKVTITGRGYVTDGSFTGSGSRGSVDS